MMTMQLNCRGAKLNKAGLYDGSAASAHSFLR